MGAVCRSAAAIAVNSKSMQDVSITAHACVFENRVDMEFSELAMDARATFAVSTVQRHPQKYLLPRSAQDPRRRPGIGVAGATAARQGETRTS